MVIYSATWTGLLLIDWVEKNYKIKYRKAQIYNILKSIGLTFQKGQGFYPEAKDRADKVDVLKKLQEERELNSVILFQDEASLSNTATVSYTWGEKGKQPLICQKQRRRERKTLFGCVNPATGIVTTKVAEKGNTLTFFQFLIAVVLLYPNQKVVMVVDNGDIIMQKD